MKLLRFGFENETMPSDVSVIVGQLADPQGSWENGEWSSDSPGGEGKFYRQDVTDLGNYSGAYSFVPGRENPNTTAIAGFSPNEDGGNLSTNTKKVFFNTHATHPRYYATNQHLKVDFTASQGIGVTYFYKINRIIGLDTTGVDLMKNDPDGTNSYDLYDFSHTDGPRYSPALGWTGGNGHRGASIDKTSWWDRKYYYGQFFSSHYLVNKTFQHVLPSFMIPNRYHGGAAVNPAAGYSHKDHMGNLFTPNSWSMIQEPQATAAGFYLSCGDDTMTVVEKRVKSNTLGGGAMVDTISLILNGERQQFTLQTPVNLSGWNSVQVKYIISPNHVFKVSLNGEEYEMYGNMNLPSSSVCDTFMIPLTCNMVHEAGGWAYHDHQGGKGSYAQSRLPNVSMCVDDVAVNNNITDVDGQLQLSDSDIIIPPFIVCTGLTITSEVAGGEFEHDKEASNALEAIQTKDDVRIFSKKSAVHRFNLETVPPYLTGLEGVNVYAKRCNINFPSYLRYLGFGLESGNELLMSDAAAHKLRPLTATERDGSISIIPDKEAKNVSQDLTTEKFNNNCSLYVEARKQIGLNFFGKADFNGGQDKRFHCMSWHKGHSQYWRSNAQISTQKKWPWGQRSYTDGNLILSNNQRSDIHPSNNNTATYNAHRYRAVKIEPVSLRNGVGEIHCKNFIVKKDTHVAIGLGNAQPGGTVAQRARYGHHINVASPGVATEYDREDYYVARIGRCQYSKGMTNTTQSVIVIYAQENIYIDGDVYFEYGHNNFHAPNELSYHSRDNNFSIVKFSGDGLIDFDMDSLVRKTNTASSESTFQQVPETILDVGSAAANAATATNALTAIDFSLEAGMRTNAVEHGKGGVYGDPYGNQDGEPVQINGSAAIGWGCGGGGGLITGWKGMLPGTRYKGDAIGAGTATASYAQGMYGPNMAWAGFNSSTPAYMRRYSSPNYGADDGTPYGHQQLQDQQYVHHDIANLWREMFISGNPNKGFRYTTMARSGSEGGLWGGGRGASWTHKELIPGIQSEYRNNHNDQNYYYSSRDKDGWAKQYGGTPWTSNTDNYYRNYHPKFAASTRGARRLLKYGHPVTGYTQFKFHATNFTDNTHSFVGTKEWLTRSDYCQMDGLPSATNNRHGLDNVPIVGWRGDETSPSLNAPQVSQFWKGANTASTAGRGGGGAPIVYLIAGGDIIIGTNGSVNARGTSPLGIYRTAYNIPAALQNQYRNIGALYWDNESQENSATQSFINSLGHVDGSASKLNGGIYNWNHSQIIMNFCGGNAGGYGGRGLRGQASLMGHGGGGGGCITFLHGGLFSNQGDINVDGADPNAYGQSRPGMWYAWTGTVGFDALEFDNEPNSFWEQAARDFYYFPGNSGSYVGKPLAQYPKDITGRHVTDARPSFINDLGILQPLGPLNCREQFSQTRHEDTDIYIDDSLISAPKGGAGAWRSFKIIGPSDVRRKI